MWMMVNLNDEAVTPNHTSNSVGLQPTKSIIRKRNGGPAVAAPKARRLVSWERPSVSSCHAGRGVRVPRVPPCFVWVAP